MSLRQWPPSRINPARKGFVSDLKGAFGLAPGAKWPSHALHGRDVAGVYVWLEGKALSREKEQFHRLRCRCPICGRDTPAGRLFQHVKAH